MGQHGCKLQARGGQNSIQDHQLPIFERMSARDENADPQWLGLVHNCFLYGSTICRIWSEALAAT